MDIEDTLNQYTLAQDPILSHMFLIEPRRCSDGASRTRPSTAAPLPLSPAVEAQFTTSQDFEAGERGKLGCYFHPGRRAQALALGYVLWPFQGRILARRDAFRYPPAPSGKIWDGLTANEGATTPGEDHFPGSAGTRW